jgi:hypothetical protein
VKPDIATIIALTRTELAAATFGRAVAFSGLTSILSDLKMNRRFDDTELEPLRQMINELSDPPPKRPPFLRLVP